MNLYCELRKNPPRFVFTGSIFNNGGTSVIFDLGTLTSPHPELIFSTRVTDNGSTGILDH